jgi:hypothetical protein
MRSRILFMLEAEMNLARAELSLASSTDESLMAKAARIRAEILLLEQSHAAPSQEAAPTVWPATV